MAVSNAQAPKIFKRKLAANHALGCQDAQHTVCRCRCRGRLHGHDHKAYQQLEEQYMNDQRALGRKEFTEAELSLLVDQIVAGIEAQRAKTTV